MSFALAALAAHLGVPCPPALLGAVARGLSIDSRTLRPGEVFVALTSEARDGHAFLPMAKAGGMAAALVSEKWAAHSRGEPWLGVQDPLQAMQSAGLFVRRLRGAPVVAVTGSNGKTTTKELLAAALAGRGAVHKTTGNLNNHLGVPMTLAAWPEGAWAAVVEMGMSAGGEIAALTRMAEPDVGLVTSVAAAHLAAFASVADIAAAKAELYGALKPTGVVVLNADDEPLVAAAEAVVGSRPIIRFGRAKGADVRLLDCHSGRGHDSAATLALTLEVSGHRYAGRLPVLGTHNAMNAAGAVAAAWALGVAPDEALAHMAAAVLPKARLSLALLLGGRATLIDDCYNANPGSVAAALAVLADVAGRGRSVAVLGDMLELGPTAPSLHHSVGARAAALGIGVLYAIGQHSAAAAEGASAGGVQSHAFATVGAALPHLVAALRPQDTWLVKGSRGMQLEQVTQALASIPASTAGR